MRERIRNAGASAYGSIQGALTTKEEDKRPEWESRGTILGLIIDIGASNASHLVLLITMLFSVKEMRKHLVPCLVGGPSGLESFMGVAACEYTKGFLVGFPTLALACWLLLLARDLMQKRLYYGLLRGGGVLEFGANRPWKDPLVLTLVAAYFHVLLHMGMMYWLLAAVEGGEQVGEELTLAAMPSHSHPALHRGIQTAFLAVHAGPADLITAHAAPTGADKQELHLLAVLIGSVLIPSTMLMVFFYLGYDLEKTLVPLSQYVHDAEVVSSGDGPSSLADLHVLNDAMTKNLLEGESKACVVDTEDDLDIKYTRLIDRYQHNKVKFMERNRSSEGFSEELPTIGLIRGLWPSDLLLRPGMIESQTFPGETKGFHRFWTVFIVLCLAWLTFAAAWLVHVTLLDFYKVGRERMQVFFHIAVMIGHIGVVVLVAIVLLQSLLIIYRTPKQLSEDEKAKIEAEASHLHAEELLRSPSNRAIEVSNNAFLEAKHIAEVVENDVEAAAEAIKGADAKIVSKIEHASEANAAESSEPAEEEKTTKKKKGDKKK